MPAQTTYIRTPQGAWKDLFTEYGISLDETAVTKLMTPAPNKEVVENKSSLQHGKRVTRETSDTRKEDRNVSLGINFIAASQADFLTKYGKFCTEILDEGFFDIKTAYVPDTIYRLTFIDCPQFQEFDRRMAKFTLNVNEPDPTNRGVNDKWETEND